MVDAGRLVEIKGKREGSGFLIADGLVLTAWHVLRPAPGCPPPSSVTVRVERKIPPNVPPSIADEQAQVIWPQEDPGPDLDFALLVLKRPAGSDGQFQPETDTPTVDWAPLGSSGRLDVEAIGYPDLAIDLTRKARDTKEVGGWTNLGDRLRERNAGRGTFEIRIRDEDAPPQKPSIAWPSMSGAAVFAGTALVGVIRIAGEEGERHQLRAVPVDRLFDREDVIKAARTAGCELPRRATFRSHGASAQRSIVWRPPALPRYLQSRSADLREISASLIDPPKRATPTRPFIVGLHGMPGAGKSTLAAEIFHDRPIVEHFASRVWLSMAPQIFPLAQANDLAAALTGTPVTFMRTDEAQGRLGQMLDGGKLLLVLDNLAKIEQIDPFLSLGPGCAIVITTTNQEALARAYVERKPVNWLLDRDSSLQLLADWAETTTEKLPPEAMDIEKACGGLPLVLAAAGALVGTNTYSWAETLAARG